MKTATAKIRVVLTTITMRTVEGRVTYMDIYFMQDWNMRLYVGMSNVETAAHTITTQLCERPKAG